MTAARSPQRRQALRTAAGTATLGVALPWLLGACAGSKAGAAAALPELGQLERELARIAQDAGGRVGVALHHIESGQALALQGTARFPMASVFKLPLALQLLARVDARALSLDKPLTITADDLRPGSGTLARAAPPPTVLSVGELLELMMVRSDNTATDLLWTEAGGAPAVRARLETLAVSGISVDRPTAGVVAGAAGIEPRRGTVALTPERFDALVRQTPRAERLAASQAFLADPRDTAMPAAVVELLLRLWRGQALKPDSSALLIETMKRCETGKGRLRAGLPRGTSIAHKTGTLRPGATNDAGIVWLPGRAGHLLLVVMVKASDLELQAQERTIAAIARAAYQHFVNYRPPRA